MSVDGVVPTVEETKIIFKYKERSVSVVSLVTTVQMAVLIWVYFGTSARMVCRRKTWNYSNRLWVLWGTLTWSHRGKSPSSKTDHQEAIWKWDMQIPVPKSLSTTLKFDSLPLTYWTQRLNFPHKIHIYVVKIISLFILQILLCNILTIDLEDKNYMNFFPQQT